MHIASYPFRCIRGHFLNWTPVWNALNREVIKNFRKERLILDPPSQKLVQDLQQTGIACTTLKELFEDDTLLSRLQVYAQAARKDALVHEGGKKFLIDLWDSYGVINARNPFFDLAVNPKILEVVNSYLGMWSWMYKLSLQITKPVPNNTPRQLSQRWHRDPKVRSQCKVFIYLSDVSEGEGPFVYVRESNRGNKWGSMFPQKLPRGSYPSLEKVSKYIPEEDIATMTGPAGTIIFADTSGLHRGGYALLGERLMSTFCYAPPSIMHFDTPSDTKPFYYRLPKEIEEQLTQAPPVVQAATPLAFSKK